MSTGVTANSDGSVTVTFDLNETGGSQLAGARIVAVREDTPGAIRQDNVMSSTTSGQAIVVKTPSLTLGNGRTIQFDRGSLEYRRKYHFYATCIDNQGWYNHPPGSSTSLNAPGHVAGVPIQNNGGLVFDPFPPTMSVTDVRSLTNGDLQVRYTLGETGQSRIDRAKIVAVAVTSLNPGEGGTSGHIPPVYKAQIRSSDNGRRSYDLDPPVM